MATDDKPSDGGEQKEAAEQGGKKKEEPKAADMSDEDKKLLDELNMLVQRLQEPDESLYGAALESLGSLIRSSTTSMTSVPKPLKFMRTHFDTVKDIHAKITEPAVKAKCADVISVLAMCSDEEAACLNYRLLGSNETVGNWGHEYVKHLCSEMVDEWKKAEEGTERQTQLTELAVVLATHCMAHNAETEACDLLMEIERRDLLVKLTDEAAYQRVALYLLSCVPYAHEPENTELMRCAAKIYKQFGQGVQTLRCHIMLDDIAKIKETFECEGDYLVKRQMAILLARHQIFLEMDESEPDHDQLSDLNSNGQLYSYLHSFAKVVGIEEAKTPEEIYKTHLEPVRPFGGSAVPDSAKMNLAASFVNGFVNCGFSSDKLITPSEQQGNNWFFKNKDYGIISAAASVGLLFRWDVENGLGQCDKFMYVSDENIKAGTLLAVGLINCGIHDAIDPATALLFDYLSSDRPLLRLGATLGLGLAYTNSKRPTLWAETEGGVVCELKKGLRNSDNTPELRALSALSMGLIGVGTADPQITNEILMYLLERDAADLKDANVRFVALAMALLFLGTQDQCDVVLETLSALPQPYGKMAATIVEVAAYAGTGNVLTIQKMLHICAEHYDTADDKKDKEKDKDKKEPEGEARVDYSTQQAVAALGIGLVAMGEDIGSAMCQRMFGHMIRYGGPSVRRAVPLALALLSTSNPQLHVLETLSKFSHDQDNATAYSAIVALGLVGAGTMNARLANMLRSLAVYHQKDSSGLMLVRIAQGLTHMGKGTMTLNAFHSDRQLMCRSAVAGLLTVCFAMLDAPNSILNGRQHYLLYCVTPAIQPRLLMSLAEDEASVSEPKSLKQCNVPVRVGQAVDAVGQAGKPKTITGFRTITTPLLLAHGERAELATDEYTSVTPHLEGLVVLKTKPTVKK